MISFLQGVLQKHHKWLFSILLLVVIVSFVFTIGNSPGIGPGRKRSQRERFFGYDLHSERDQQALFQETWLSTSLQGIPLFFEAQLQPMALVRAIELHYAQELGLPDPDEERLKEKVRKMSRFFAPGTGVFDAATYEKVLQDLLKDPRVTPATIQKVLSDDWKIEKVREALGRQGYTLIHQARETLAKEETRYSFDVLSLTDDAGAEETVLPEEDVRAYVSQHTDRFLEPESRRLDFIEFAPERYRPSIPPATKESLQKFYLDHKKDFEKLPEDSDELKQALVEAYERDQMKVIADQRAGDFACQLYEQEVHPDDDAFAELLGTFGVTLEHLPPCVPGQPNADGRFSPKNLAVAATLEEEHPFSDPVSMENGSTALLVLREILPPHPSEFEAVREKAAAELREERRREAFQARCREVSAKLSQACGAEDPEAFGACVQELGLSRQNFDQLRLQELQGKLSQATSRALGTLSEGQCSPELLQGERCEWVRLQAKRVDASALGEEQIQKTLEGLEEHSSQIFSDSFLMENLEDFAKRQPKRP